ncbi:putative RNA-directed DNA polymerase [Helianthus debilis subsp. tardiflorus]
MAGGKDDNVVGKSESQNQNLSDHNSPFYIHASDYTRQMQVSEALTDGNYTDWAQEMLNFLFAKNKVGFIDGTLKKPEPDSDDYMAWMRADAMIKGWLHTAMEKDIRTSVKYATTAQEVWTDLKERFGKGSAPRAYELKQSLSGIRQEGTSVSAYYTRLRTLWDEIESVFPLPICNCNKCTCDVGKKLREHKDKERLYEFLLGLDPEFATIRTQILAMQPIPGLGSVYHLVADDEQQRVITGTKRPTDAAAFQASFSAKQSPGQSHIKFVKETKKGIGSEPVDHCDHCGKDGHKKSGCFKIIGYPEWWIGKGKGTSKPKAAFAANMTSPIPGLTEEQYQQFINFFGSNEQMDKGEGKPTANSLSSRELIGAGECSNGLYEMEIIKNERQAMMVNGNTWHKRLGHVSISKLSHLDFAKDLSLNSKHFCDSCNKAKFTRLPFAISASKTNACFELVHCDVWGKYRTPSFTQARYFLTIVDDFSRNVWVFLLKHKHEAGNCLIEFHKMVQVQFEKNIKRIRCDNGGEFVSNKMLDFYAKNGIMLETTCPYTPQQNGVVERKHRHLLETARALKFEANLPTRFWGECVLTATHIINRIPSDVINGKTPYELLHDKLPSYEHLKVFGCLAYYLNTETHGDKFEMRGRPGTFLGYPPGTKGYKIYDLQLKKIFITRHVKFYEDVFPFTKVDIPKNEEEIFVMPKGWVDSTVSIPNGETQHLQRETIPNSEDINQSATTFNDNNHTSEVPGPIEDLTTSPSTSAQPQSPSLSLAEEDLTTPQHDPSPNTIPTHPETSPNVPEQAHSLDPHSAARPKRTRTQPSYLKQYDVKLPPSLDVEHSHPGSEKNPSTVHSLSHFVSYDNFSNSHKAFLSAITSNNEPKFFGQAIRDPKWIDAMKAEIQALEQNQTWTLEDLPDGKRAIDSKWVYKIKYKPNGDIERYKARLVAKGFTQLEGIDFHDTFAPVAKLVTVRTLLAVAVKRGWHTHQLDVNNAFLHGDLDEDIYMKVPQGFQKEGDNRVCKLNKSLYGLKQASRNWYQKFTTSLQNLGFKSSKADHSLFLFKRNGVFIAALIYVDDVIITGNDLTKIKFIKDFLDQQFSIKDLGPLKFFLGIEVARTKQGMVLSQRKYTLDILEDAGMLGCRPSSFPMEQNLRLDKREEETRVDANQYRRLVGRLLYLQATRPDIAYSVNVLSQFVSDPRASHLEAANRVLRYLKKTPGQGILLAKDGGTNLTAYCDSDWLGCPMTRRSRTGYLLLLGGTPISWKSKKQLVVSRSSAEAEYRAMASTVSEVLWIRWLLSELDISCHHPTQLFCDNQAARHIANNPVFHERTKHVEMDCYFVRERVESKEILPMAINTKDQIADVLTKPLGTQDFQDLTRKLGIVNLHAPT